jgi:hypothetical protein
MVYVPGATIADPEPLPPPLLPAPDPDEPPPPVDPDEPPPHADNPATTSNRATIVKPENLARLRLLLKGKTIKTHVSTPIRPLLSRAEV